MTFFSITCAQGLTDFPRGVNVSQSTAMTARGRKALFVKTIVLSFFLFQKIEIEGIVFCGSFSGMVRKRRNRPGAPPVLISIYHIHISNQPYITQNTYFSINSQDITSKNGRSRLKVLLLGSNQGPFEMKVFNRQSILHSAIRMFVRNILIF